MKKFLALFSALISIILMLFVCIALFWTMESSLLSHYLVSIFRVRPMFLILIFFLWASIYFTVGLFIQLRWISIGKTHKTLQNKLVWPLNRIVWLILWTSALFLILFFAYYYHVKSLEDLKESYRQEQVREDIQKFINAPLTR